MVILDAPLNRRVVVFVILFWCFRLSSEKRVGLLRFSYKQIGVTLTCLHTAKTTTTKKLHKFCLQRDEVEMYRMFVVATINVYQRFLP